MPLRKAFSRNSNCELQIASGGTLPSFNPSGTQFVTTGFPNGRASLSAITVTTLATGDKHVLTEHSTASSDRESFKDESRRIDANGGADSSSSHNKIESPGKKYRRRDGSN